eukprot:CAMPEP_0119555474 /NCGR_PEP_ID=MMETSP1352-20130426/7671_1 /TAXON_ID=265584 /ORGANISM="Stauroneis constricta, Strain CCMP1120" /LENGTH=1205 /DNA_ID=CAMNT_0007602237 /DNA_START=170 /DNA_END=3787 /DNA_ORIENTATION=+
MASDNVPEWMQKLKQMKQKSRASLVLDGGEDGDTGTAGDGDEAGSAAAMSIEERIAAKKRESLANRSAATGIVDQELFRKMNKQSDAINETAEDSGAPAGMGVKQSSSKSLMSQDDTADGSGTGTEIKSAPSSDPDDSKSKDEKEETVVVEDVEEGSDGSSSLPRAAGKSGDDDEADEIESLDSDDDDDDNESRSTASTGSASKASTPLASGNRPQGLPPIIEADKEDETEHTKRLAAQDGVRADAEESTGMAPLLSLHSPHSTKSSTSGKSGAMGSARGLLQRQGSGRSVTSAGSVRSQTASARSTRSQTSNKSQASAKSTRSQTSARSATSAASGKSQRSTQSGRSAPSQASAQSGRSNKSAVSQTSARTGSVQSGVSRGSRASPAGSSKASAGQGSGNLSAQASMRSPTPSANASVASASHPQGEEGSVGGSVSTAQSVSFANPESKTSHVETVDENQESHFEAPASTGTRSVGSSGGQSGSGSQQHSTEEVEYQTGSSGDLRAASSAEEVYVDEFGNVVEDPNGVEEEVVFDGSGNGTESEVVVEESVSNGAQDDAAFPATFDDNDGIPATFDDERFESQHQDSAVGGGASYDAPGGDGTEYMDEELAQAIRESMYTGASVDPPEDVENQQKPDPPETAPRRSASEPFRPHPLCYLLCCCILIATFLIILFTIILDRDSDGTVERSVSNATAAPTTTPLDPPPKPELSSDDEAHNPEAVTTAFDPLQIGNCNFGGLDQPHVIDQCACSGIVSIIADDIQERYDDLLATWVPTFDPDFSSNIASCSTRNQALLWLSTGINNGGSDEVERFRRFALAEMYIATNGPSWTNSNNWLTTRASCTWEGATCNNAQPPMLINLMLQQNNLVGSLPNGVAHLDSLLTIELPSNSLTGPIPKDYFDMPNLENLDLSNNGLTGALVTPNDNSAIMSLNLEMNRIAGNIPNDIDNLSLLTSLKLANNEIEGTIPIRLSNVQQLRHLDVRFNRLRSNIPTEISALTSLTSLGLGDNVLEGTFGASFSSLSNLEFLSIVNAPSLSGRIFDSFSQQVTNLVELHLANTQIGGNIPDTIGNLKKLTVLNLSQNKLRGDIPVALGQLSDTLTKLHLNDNSLSERIPDALSSLVLLEELLLNDNELTGQIPASLESLTNLNILTLDGNQLTGRLFDDQGICQLGLSQFVTDCRIRDGADAFGVICPIPTCCTSCRGA